MEKKEKGHEDRQIEREMEKKEKGHEDGDRERVKWHVNAQKRMSSR